MNLNDSDNLSEILKCKFTRMFLKLLREANGTFRTDNLGNDVEIPPGYTFKIGKDGFGVAVGPCDKVVFDRVGRVHEVS